MPHCKGVLYSSGPLEEEITVSILPPNLRREALNQRHDSLPPRKRENLESTSRDNPTWYGKGCGPPLPTLETSLANKSTSYQHPHWEAMAADGNRYSGSYLPVVQDYFTKCELRLYYFQTRQLLRSPRNLCKSFLFHTSSTPTPTSGATLKVYSSEKSVKDPDRECHKPMRLSTAPITQVRVDIAGLPHCLYTLLLKPN